MNKELFLKFMNYLHEIENTTKDLDFRGYFNFADYNELFWSPLCLLFLEYYTKDGWNQVTEYAYHCARGKSWCKDENGLELFKDDEFMYYDLETNFKK